MIHRLVPHLKALQRLYEIYADGFLGWAGVAEQLNREGFRFRSRDGMLRPFDRDDVRRCLDLNETYAGNLTRGRSQSARGAMIYLKGAWDPILPLPLINRALTLLESRRSVEVRPDKKYPYALTPRLFCASCKSLV